MESRRNTQFHRFRSVFAAPCVGGTYPEHLFRAVGQTGQSLFRFVPLDPLAVRVIGLFYAAIIGDVLPLGVYPVQL